MILAGCNAANNFNGTSIYNLAALGASILPSFVDLHLAGYPFVFLSEILLVKAHGKRV